MSGLSNQTLVAKDNRGFRSWTRRRSTEKEKPLPLKQQILLQLVLIGILITVMFPILWIFSLSIDPRNLFRPEGLNLIPPGASLDAYAKVLDAADQQRHQLPRADAQQPQDRGRDRRPSRWAWASSPRTRSPASSSVAARS